VSQTSRSRLKKQESLESFEALRLVASDTDALRDFLDTLSQILFAPIQAGWNENAVAFAAKGFIPAN